MLRFPKKIAKRQIPKQRRKATIQVSISREGRIAILGDTWAQERFIEACQRQGWQIKITRSGHCG